MTVAGVSKHWFTTQLETHLTAGTSACITSHLLLFWYEYEWKRFFLTSSIIQVFGSEKSHLISEPKNCQFGLAFQKSFVIRNDFSHSQPPTRGRIVFIEGNALPIMLVLYISEIHIVYGLELERQR